MGVEGVAMEVGQTAPRSIVAGRAVKEPKEQRRELKRLGAWMPPMSCDYLYALALACLGLPWRSGAIRMRGPGLT